MENLANHRGRSTTSLNSEPVTSAASSLAQWRVPRLERWLPLLTTLLVACLWEIAARAAWISPLFFPPPTRSLQTLFEMLLTGDLWPILSITLYRLLVGVVLGAGAGLVLGWVMGAIRPVRIAIDPIVAALHPIPKVALFPIFLVVLGIGEASKIALVALTAFFPMLLNTLAGTRQIDRLYWEVATSFGASRLTLIRRIILPGSLPMALTGLRLALNSALVVTIAVEMLSARQGLGASIWLAWQTMRIHQLYAILIVVALLGLGFNFLAKKLAEHLAPWQPDNDA